MDIEQLKQMSISELYKLMFKSSLYSFQRAFIKKIIKIKLKQQQNIPKTQQLIREDEPENKDEPENIVPPDEKKEENEKMTKNEMNSKANLSRLFSEIEIRNIVRNNVQPNECIKPFT